MSQAVATLYGIQFSMVPWTLPTQVARWHQVYGSVMVVRGLSLQMNTLKLGVKAAHTWATLGNCDRLSTTTQYTLLGSSTTTDTVTLVSVTLVTLLAA